MEQAEQKEATSRKRTSRPRSSTTTRKGEEQLRKKSAATPPTKRKNEALVLKHIRLRSLDVQQTEAVVQQRQSDPNDVMRKQYERGVLVDTALGARGVNGMWGLLSGERLAELLRSDVDGLINFLLSQGVVPTMIQEYRSIMGGLSDAIQGARVQTMFAPGTPAPGQVNRQTEVQAFTAVTEIADEADSVTSMFFGGASSS